MLRLLRLLAVAAAIGFFVTMLVALVLILTQPPGPVPGGENTDFDFSVIPPAPDAPPLEPYPTRDGKALNVRRYPTERPDAPLLILVHGSGWHGLQHHRLATHLAESVGVNVLVPDLRGHGPNPERRGDVDYIGQLEDDLADLITQQREPAQPVYLLGHSSGGGLVVRMAGGPHGELLDGVILLAPYLGHDAPTTRPDSGGWAQPLVRRIIGLSIFNQFGIEDLNDRTVLQFAFPREVLDGPLGQTATPAYSYRMMISYAPRADLASDLAALPPWLLLVGSDDEAFLPDAYAPLMTEAAPEGEIRLISEAGHLDLVDSEAAWTAIRQWLQGR